MAIKTILKTAIDLHLNRVAETKTAEELLQEALAEYIKYTFGNRAFGTYVVVDAASIMYSVSFGYQMNGSQVKLLDTAPVGARVIEWVNLTDHYDE